MYSIYCAQQIILPGVAAKGQNDQGRNVINEGSSLAAPAELETLMTEAAREDRGQPTRIRTLALWAVGFWTIVILASLAWNFHSHQQEVYDTARSVARAYAEKDVLWRTWNMQNGGVYLSVTDELRPDESLANVPQRDIVVSPDRTLTLIHVPAMFAQVRELADQNTNFMIGRIKSPNPLGPDMVPDAWEDKAFQALQQGASEYSEIVVGPDGEQVRFLAALRACTICVAARPEQNLKLGDLVAGLSYALPLAPFWADERRHLVSERTAHLLFWFLGLAGVGLGFSRVRAQLRGRMAAEEETRHAYGELRQIFEAVGSPIRIVDSEFNVLRVNRAFALLAGIATEEAVGRKCHEAFFCADCDTSCCCTRRAMEARAPVHCETVIVLRDGSKKNCDLTASPYFDPAGRMLGVIQSFNDVTGRQQAMEQLSKAEGEWERTFMAIGDVVTIQDTDMRLVRVNQATCDLFGVPAGQLVGRYCYEVFRGEVEPCAGCPEIKAMQENRPHLAEITHAALRKTFMVSASPVCDESGAVIGLIHIAKDITEQKRMEAQFRQAQKMEAVGTLASGVAHDFNNLLTGITGYTQLMLREVGDGSPLTTDLEEVLKLAQRSADLTRQLLAFSRQQAIRPVVLDPNQVLLGVAKMLQRLIGEDVTLQLELGEGVGCIEADPGQLEQIIINLAVNARDAMPTGGILRIATSLVMHDELACADCGSCPTGTWVRLLVRDTGQGMDQATQERIFEPFFTTKELGRGTGLGLSTVYGIVRQHRGSVRVESTPGQGSSFHLYFPSVVGREGVRPSADLAEKQLTGTETIMLVEDDARLLALLQRMLRESGYQVVTAHDPREAAALFSFRKEQIDLLLTDVIMPGMDGRELHALLLAEKPALKVLFMSGYTDEIMGRRGIHLGQAPFLQKPFSQEQLLVKIRQVLAGGVSATT